MLTLKLRRMSAKSLGDRRPLNLRLGRVRLKSSACVVRVQQQDGLQLLEQELEAVRGNLVKCWLRKRDRWSYCAMCATDPAESLPKQHCQAQTWTPLLSTAILARTRLFIVGD